jgi:hypothetical protein
MPEVMEMEIRQLRLFAAPFKPFPGMREQAILLILEHPGHVNSGPYSS